MARKTAIVTITAEGRDQGKVFNLTEMPAMQAERWATRALLALSRSGTEISEDVSGSGLAGVAMLGMKAFAGLNYHDAEPLLDEMMSCVSTIPDPKNHSFMRPTVENDFEEVSTILKLRAEIITLHTGFSMPAAISKLTTATGILGQNDMPNIQTSPNQ